MNDIHQHILALFEDTSFPPLVLLDGAWGEGKSYYTENTLIPMLRKENQDCVLLSLTGLSNISDFKDRLLSKSLLNEQLNSEQGNSMRRLTSTLLTSFGGEAGSTISSILSGATGLIKESLLSKIKDKFIFIDDLDRVKEPNLCNLIIGECLQLVDNKNNIKFIFIVNNDECKVDENLKEKVFSGIVKLNRSISEAINIAFEDYDWFEKYEHQILKMVQTKRIKNLRILKRCSKKIDKIYDLLKSDQTLDLVRSMNEVINAVIIVSYYHYEEGLTEIQIKANSKYNLPTEDKDIKYIDLQNINYFLTHGFMSYCVGGSNWNISLDDLGRLPKKSCPIDTFIFKNNFDLDDEEFKDGLEELYNYIFIDKNVEFSKWFEASYYYNILQENHFISDEKPVLLDCFTDLLKAKTFDYSGLKERHHRLKINDTKSVFYENYEIHKSKYYKEQDRSSNADILKKMMVSWQDIDLEIYKRFRVEAFFNKFSLDELIACIKNWKNSDVILFSDFIHDRFKSSTNQKYLAAEIDILEKLSLSVKTEYEAEENRRRKGSLYSLFKNLKAINKESLETHYNN